MADSTRQPLTTDEVRHVAKLARLALSDEQIAQFRTQLAAVLDYIDKLRELDVTGVEPMAHPIDVFNRLDEDEPGAALSLEDLFRNAPATEDRYLAVPKVLAEES